MEITEISIIPLPFPQFSLSLMWGAFVTMISQYRFIIIKVHSLHKG